MGQRRLDQREHPPGGRYDEERRAPRIPVHRRTSDLLREQWASHDELRRSGTICPSVFHRAGKPIRSFIKIWRAACKSAGCPGRIPHDLRRTAVRNFERAGVPRSTAMAMVGHKTESIYHRYTIVNDTSRLEAAEKLNLFGRENSSEHRPPLSRATGTEKPRKKVEGASLDRMVLGTVPGTVTLSAEPPAPRTVTHARKSWRRRPDLNRGWRFCRPLPYHLATAPLEPGPTGVTPCPAKMRGNASEKGKWSGKRDSNPRLRPWQGRTLPLSYSRSHDLRKVPYHTPSAASRQAHLGRDGRQLTIGRDQWDLQRCREPQVRCIVGRQSSHEREGQHFDLVN